MFKNISTGFGTISIAGLCKTGKSYLLNKMLLNKTRESKGFQVGKIQAPCTKGLWIYNKPIIGISNQGESIPVFIIDTEGLGSAEDGEINHDMKIFTIAVLISSCLIYNSLNDSHLVDSLNHISNLSKFLQFKSNETYEEFFPNLIWIIRDFNSKENNKIDFLNNNKNSFFQESLKKYFPERDCQTIVRPVLDENDLPNLDTISDEKLKVEFIEQIIILRKKILKKCKVKKFLNREINGEQFINIIQSYLDMLNQNLILSLDNIWSNLCRNEIEKWIDLADKEYEKTFRENVLDANRKYFDQEDIKNFHQKSKENSITLFKSKSFGQFDNFINELKERIKDKYSQYKQVNEEELKNAIYKYLKMRFEGIEFKLKCNEFKNMEELENHLNLVEKDVTFTFSDSFIRNELTMDFKIKLLIYAATYLTDNLEKNLEIKNEDYNSMIEKYNNELQDIKEKNEKDSKRKEDLIEQLSKENFSFKTELNVIKEKFIIQENESNEKIKIFSDKINELKRDYTKENEELKDKYKSIEEIKIKSERKCIKIQAEFDQEKALLDMKIEHLNKMIEDRDKREKSSGSDLKSQLKESQNAHREVTNKNEKIIKDLSIQIELFKEKIFDLESNIANKEHLNELEKIKSDEILIKITNERDSFNEKYLNFKKKLEEEKDKNINELEIKNKEIQNLQIQLRYKEDDYSTKSKTLEEELLRKNLKLERESLIQKQNNEFLELKCQDLTRQLNEQKNNLEKLIKSLESKLNENEISHSEEISKRIEEIKSLFENEKKQLENQHERDKDIFKKEIKNLQEKITQKNISDLENENEIKNLKSEIQRINNKIENLNNEKSQLEESYKHSQNEYMKKIREMNEEFQKHLEDKEKNFQNEIKNLNINSEDSVSQFKSLFEIEKMRLEDKLKEEKLKNENKIKYLNEENEFKFREFEKELREEMEVLQDDYNSLESEHQNYVYTAEHEVLMLNQKINSLESSLKETKENLIIQQNQFNLTLDSKIDQFNNERKEFLNKIEEIRMEKEKKEKEIFNLTQKKENLEKSLYDNEQLYNKHRKQFEEENKEIIFKFENYKMKQQENLDELTIQKMESSRETALLKQQIEFLNTKLEEQIRINESNQKEFGENFEQFKYDLLKEYLEKLEILQKEKEEILEKLNKKKKELRDLEQTFLKQTCLLEKEKNNINDKFNLLDERFKETTEYLQKEVERLTKELMYLKSEYYKEIDNLRNINDELRNKLRELQSQLNDTKETSETDKNLIEAKLKLTEKQKEEYKSELIETQSKAEKIFEAFQKKLTFEKGQIDLQHTEKIKDLEMKYQNLISNLKESHQNINSELVIYIGELECELKNLSIQAELKNKSMTDPTQINMKINDLIDVQNKLKKELDDSKNEKNKKISELQNLNEKEREINKMKMNDLESRYKEAEGRRGLLLIEYEKERSRWILEKEHYHSNMMELQDTIERLQRKVETLLKEIEKIKFEKEKEKEKSDKKLNGILNYNNNINSNLILGNKSDKSTNKTDNEISSIEFNKPKLFDNIKSKILNHNNKTVNNFNSEDLFASDKFDFIFNNNKAMNNSKHNTSPIKKK